MTLSNLPVEIWHDIATHYDGMNKPDRARYKELSLVSREFCFAFQPYVFSTISLVIRYHFSRTTGYTHWLLHQQEKLAFFRSPDISFAIRKCVIRAVGAHAEDEVIESYIASLKYFSRLRQLDFIHVIFSHRTFQLLVELDHLPLSIVRMFRCEMSPTAQTMVEGWLSIAQRRKYLNENEDSDYPPVRASGNSLFVLGPNGPPFKLDTLVIDHRYHRGSNDLLILWVKLLCDPNSLKCVSYTNPVCTYPHLIQLPDTTSPPKVFDPDFIPLFSNISRLSISRAIFDNWHDFCLFLRHFTGLQRLRIFPIDADISAQIAFDVSHKLPKLSLLPKLKLLYLFRNKALMQHLLPWQSNPDLQVAPNLQHVIIDETSARTADTVQDIVDWQRGRKVAADGDLAYDERLVSLRIPAGRYFHRHAIPPELSYLRAVCILVGKESPDCIVRPPSPSCFTYRQLTRSPTAMIGINPLPQAR